MMAPEWGAAGLWRQGEQEEPAARPPAALAPALVPQVALPPHVRPGAVL